MRVIAGKYKGRRLAPLKNITIRPTIDRVKESVFSILHDKVIDAKFLDLCAGTGNIGIEALSRGAKQVTFIECEEKCVRLILLNLKACGLDTNNHVQVLRRDVIRGIAELHKQTEVFDLIYLDPPYHADLYSKCLSHISIFGILHSNGILIAEHDKHTMMPSNVDNLICVRQKQYGDTYLSFYYIQTE